MPQLPRPLGQDRRRHSSSRSCAPGWWPKRLTVLFVCAWLVSLGCVRRYVPRPTAFSVCRPWRDVDPDMQTRVRRRSHGDGVDCRELGTVIRRKESRPLLLLVFGFGNLPTRNVDMSSKYSAIAIIVCLPATQAQQKKRRKKQSVRSYCSSPGRYLSCAGRRS